MKGIELKHKSVAIVLALILAMALSGCIGGSSKPSRFYLLRSMESAKPDNALAKEKKSISLLIGPITLPAYLDRNQFVTRTTGNELVIAEFKRWGEPLKDSFYRVLLEDLSLLLGGAEIYAYDRSGSIKTDYQVVMDVTRFDSLPEKGACLTVFWRVLGNDGNSPLISRKSVFREPVASGDMEAVVAAQNQTLTAFGREIAATIQSHAK
jgi:uncharacterized lipoprotein YmbA